MKYKREVEKTSTKLYENQPSGDYFILCFPFKFLFLHSNDLLADRNIDLMLYRFLIVIGFVFTQNLFGQDSEYMSGTLRSEEDIPVFIDSANYYLNINPQRSFDFVEQALEMSLIAHNTTNEALCYQMLGRINKHLEQYKIALEYYNKASKLIPPQDPLAFHIFSELASVYESLGDYTASLKYYLQYLNYVRNNNNVPEEIEVRYNLAHLYISMGVYQKALDEYNTIQTLEGSRNNPPGVGTANTMKGEVYLMQNQPEEAIVNYKKAAEIADETQDTEAKSKSLRRMGKAYRQTQQYEEELDVRQQALALSEERADIEEQVEDNLMIGEVYMEKQQPAEAVKYIQRSVDLSEQTGNMEKKGIALKTLSDAYKEQGEYDKALVVYKEYVSTIDEVYTQREQKLQKNLEIVANVNRKLQRIDLLERDFEITKRAVEVLERERLVRSKELRNQELIMYALILIIIALAVSTFLVYRSSQQKRKANLLLALRSLRSQMNPHFIFNSLNSVNSFIAENDERMANKYLSEFSQLMRSVLENSKHDFVPLASEIDVIKLYLKLEHSRFKEKFDYTLNIDENLLSSEYMIPPMLIQPYIENAIWHGLRYKEEKGLLQVIIQPENECLLATVADNGIGRKRSQELKTKHQKNGTSTGLKNTRSRLEIINDIYKTKYEIEITDQDAASGAGTIVQLRIPVENEI